MQNSHHRRRRWRRLGQKESILFNTHYMKVVVKCAATGGKKGRPRIHFSPPFFLRCVLSLTSPKDPNRTRHKKNNWIFKFPFYLCSTVPSPTQLSPGWENISDAKSLSFTRMRLFCLFLAVVALHAPTLLTQDPWHPPTPLPYTIPWFLPHPEKRGCVTCRKYVCVCVQITTFCAALRGRISAAKDRCEGAP